ncbi:MULE transposase [Nostoc sp. 'Lobaria pulmonaria (5183) cyanobiont']|nr:MULE transposase [Nostoc sp. 'Lobaria pulmonaria (5183) cyanobiont']
MIEKKPRHRPQRYFPDAKRIIVKCERELCIHCNTILVSLPSWHMRKTIQTLNGAVFVAGKGKECANSQCEYFGKHYLACGVLKYSLPQSTYGLDVLAFIGWQHEHEHQQLVEIQRLLKQRGVEINERNVGKLYRQFLALLGGTIAHTQEKLAATAHEHGGLIWAIDALQPEGHGTLLYVLYEVLSGTPVSGIQLQQAQAQRLIEWLQPYKELPFTVLATLSDGESAIIAAMNSSWSNAPHQRCQAHFLSNLSESVLPLDTKLRQQLKADLDGLPQVPDRSERLLHPNQLRQPDSSPPFLAIPYLSRDAELMAVESQIRAAIRDCVNRTNRKPFNWGGIEGYQQLSVIGEILRSLPCREIDTDYLSLLSVWVDLALLTNCSVASDLEEAHKWLRRIAECLHYPEHTSRNTDDVTYITEAAKLPLTSFQVRCKMEELLQQFVPDSQQNPAQFALKKKLQLLWHKYGANLLHCYDIPGLPPDNLKIESKFSQLRRHQRRISGRKSTVELRDFGQYQVLFFAENEKQLLEQIQQVPITEYKTQRRRLAMAEAPRQQKRRLHRNPVSAIQALVNQHQELLTVLEFQALNTN